MGTDTNYPNTQVFDDGNATRGYRPRLTFYHASGKGNGSAAQFEVAPAGGDRAGAVYMSLARQKSAPGVDDDGKRKYASFDWQNKVIVKLNFNDLCQMLAVFNGKSEAIDNGLYHDSRDKTTIINLARQTEPFPGLVLDVSRKAKQGGSEPIRVRIVFKDTEAYGLGAVLEQSLSVVAFGIHREFRPYVSSARRETEPSVV